MFPLIWILLVMSWNIAAANVSSILSAITSSVHLYNLFLSGIAFLIHFMKGQIIFRKTFLYFLEWFLVILKDLIKSYKYIFFFYKEKVEIWKLRLQ